MSNRRNYGSGGGYGGGNFNNRNSFGLSGSPSGVNPWQSGNAPGRGGTSSGVAQSLLASTNLLNQLSAPDSQLALAKLITSILPVQQSVQQPPSLLSLNSSFGQSNARYGGQSYGNDRFRRDDRQNFRNRRPGNDRNKDKTGDNKSRSDSKTKTKFDKTKGKSDDDKNEDVKGDSSDVNEGRDDDTEKTKKDEDEKEEGPIPGYENIPQKLFHCHVCNKSMWNDVSYDTHVKGRNHRLKLRDLEDDYQVQTDMMRQIAALSLKLDELRKGGKRRPYPEQYCKMCDLHFNSMSMFAHRSTEEHQSLKRFIHPSCDVCKKDFQVRIEYDEHLLTAPHLQNEAKILLRKEKFEKDPKARDLKDNEVHGTTISEEAANVGEKGDVELSEEDQKLVKEIIGDKTAVPDYDPEVENPIGLVNIVPASGFYCKICRIFLLKDSVVDTHCRTIKHYNKYIQVLKDEAVKKQKEEGEKRKSDGTEDKESNSKRRKMDDDTEVNGGDKYDPEETMDDESSQADPSKIDDSSKQDTSTDSQNEDDKPKRSNTARRGARRSNRK